MLSMVARFANAKRRGLGPFSHLLAAVVIASCCGRADASEPLLEKVDVFTAGQGGYGFYRIPGIVVTAKGTVLVYCEARHTRSDWAPMDILLRRSTDGGKTWNSPHLAAEIPGPKTVNPVAKHVKPDTPTAFTNNNPVAIADRDGTVHLLRCLEYMRCFYQRSTDDGLTFSEPVEITAAFEAFRPEYDWKVLSTGPGHGIQLRSGRLLATVRLSTAASTGNPLRPTVATTVFSDDGGRTWQRGEIAVPNTADWVNPNEPLVVELSDGRVMMNVRNESRRRRRLVTISPNGATDWSTPRFDDALWENSCMAGLLRLNPGSSAEAGWLLFANPHHPSERRNLSVKLSRDEGATWPVNKTLEEGLSAYADLAQLPDGTVLCFYERGSADQKELYGRLTLARFSIDWLTMPENR
jgi:sialidase-1